MENLFSMALIASVENNENNQKIYKLRKSLSVEVKNFNGTEIDDSLVECLDNTPELKNFNLMVFIADGSLSQDVIGLHRVYMVKEGVIFDRTITVLEKPEVQKAFGEMFFALLEDLNEYLANEETSEDQ